MTSDEDTASLLLSPSVDAQSDTPPEQLQQRPHKKSKLAGSGNVSISAAVIEIFLVSLHSIDLEKPTDNEEDARAFGDRRQRRGRQSIS
jgi:hypothetical protein